MKFSVIVLFPAFAATAYAVPVSRTLNLTDTFQKNVNYTVDGCTLVSAYISSFTCYVYKANNSGLTECAAALGPTATACAVGILHGGASMCCVSPLIVPYLPIVL